MTMPILATAFMIAAAAILAMRATIVAASHKSTVKKSMVKVRSQRYPANTKTQG
ncbi:hypothetical protein [Mesorhizobium sp. B263B2A]|uniref:hypothetical protein n=1 Tax=Mesorhizobium sp. B263B2A TaxID=2876669 RepID=UPI001CD06AC8|nr:hypothetical protein [Mesorhizobium sp. B263B2A]MCA0032971.1 hypothetical protein [Mesorhizobium sp. B263B2A]